MSNLQVIVVGLGSAGDVNPNIALALALQKRGHKVVLVAPSLFRPVAQQVNLEFVPLLKDADYEAAINDPNLWHPWRSFSVVARRLILPAIRPVYEAIAQRMSPTTVVAAPGMAFGARIANEKLGVPLATIHLQPVMFRSIVAPPCFGFPDIIQSMPHWLRRIYLRAADALLIDSLLSKETNSFRAELGLPPVHRFFNGWIHSPQLTIGMFPEWFAPPAPDWPPNVRLTGFPLWDGNGDTELSPELSEFLASGTPPLVFTAGTAMLQAREFFRVSMEVCRSTGWRGILLTQFPEQLPSPLPPNVTHFSYVPFRKALPSVAALVHHGGIGTMSQAIAAGTPQLVVPWTHDQPDNAVRIRRLGLGDFVTPNKYNVASATECLKRLMAEDTKRSCQERAATISQDTPIESICSMVEGLASGAATAAPI